VRGVEPSLEPSFASVGPSRPEEERTQGRIVAGFLGRLGCRQQFVAARLKLGGFHGRFGCKIIDASHDPDGNRLLQLDPGVFFGVGMARDFDGGKCEVGLGLGLGLELGGGGK
jgi:hypothetical protein